MKREAVISECGTYRYRLYREWEQTDKMPVLWIMLNPSTADAIQDDPTIRRVTDFSWRWGFDRVEIVNAYALRSTNPAHLWSHPDPVGPLNDLYIMDAAEYADETIIAWGVNVEDTRARWVRQLLARFSKNGAGCLGRTKGGHPKHPLYLAKTTPRVTF